MIPRFLIAATLLTLPAAVFAQGNIPYPRAQRLVENIVAKDPDMLDVLMHVTPMDTDRNIVVAAHLTKANGEASGDDDLGVMTTGKPLVEVQKDGVRIGVLVQMRDAAGHAIGALGLMYPYRPGDDQAATLKRSLAIRDGLAREIPSRAALFGDAARDRLRRKL